VSAAPIVVGVILDQVGPESPLIGVVRSVAEAATASGRLDRPVELVVEATAGLPQGSAAEVAAGFERLEARRPVAILGPAITDNGLVVRELAERSKIPCINWTGSDATRSEWMFHYQIGSLEEEPYLLAEHLFAQGHRRLVLVQDRSPIGGRYGSFFEAACERRGLTLVAKSLISPVATDLSETAAEVREHDADALVYLGLGLSAGTLGRALADAGGANGPVVMNSSGMFGWAHADWVGTWEGWTYVDAWSEDNRRLQGLLAEHPGAEERSPLMLAAGDDMGRLLVEGLAGAELLTAAAVKEALERVKCLPASLGLEGTSMGFGQWDRAALKGGFIVLRRWQGGRSVPVDMVSPTGG
jgi:ABC-type branched-subunit amino acid transport system substrate-binding protein